jgi:lipoprotein-anchoring transpeptidase ErfK/SrfK
MKVLHTCFVGLMAGIVLLAAGCGQVDGKGIKMNVSPADQMVAQAEGFEAEGKKLDAKGIYQQIISEHSDYKDIEKVQVNLYRLNMEILLSNIPVPQSVVYEVKSGDSLGKISKEFNVSMDLIKTSNGMKNNTVRLGQQLRIWTGKFSIYVDKSQNVLLLKSDDEILKTYDVSTGSNNSTPVGTFKIVNKIENPVWYKDTGAVIPPDSPENALGSRWMGFDLKGYGIHGTIDPDKIGQQVTSGCVRMRNVEVEELYKIVPRGTAVTIVD